MLKRGSLSGAFRVRDVLSHYAHYRSTRVVIFRTICILLLLVSYTRAYSQQSYFTSEPVWYSGPPMPANTIVAGDVNLDGYLDIALGVQGEDIIYFNEGGIMEVFPSWGVRENYTDSRAAFGDINGDGYLDLVLGNNRANIGLDETYSRDLIFLNDGEGYFDQPDWRSDIMTKTYSVALGDIDGDGGVDMVCAMPRYLMAYLNQGSMVSTSPDWISDSTRTYFALDLGDVDADGDLDLVCGRRNARALYLNDGNMFAQTPVWYIEDTLQTSDVMLGDITGDGLLDLVCGNNYDRNTIHVNIGGIFFDTPVWESDSTFSSQSIDLGDVDGDGDLDLVCGNRSQPNTLYLNENGMLGTAPVWMSNLENQTLAICLADVTGDGAPDLVCGNRGESTTIYANVRKLLPPEPAWYSSTENRTMSVELGDIDNDGDLDLVCGNFGEPDMLFLNDAGTIDTVAAWATSEAKETYAIALADIDADGLLDYICGNSDANTLYLNTESGYPVQPDWVSQTSNVTFSLAVGDVNSDGALDLVCGNSGNYNDIYLNEGIMLSDTSNWHYSSPHYNMVTRSIALGDLDGDGDLDLAFGNSGVNWNFILANKMREEGRFVPLFSLWTYNTYSVAFNDVDADGDLDFVAGTSGITNYLYEFENLDEIDTGGAVIKTIWTGPRESTQDINLADMNGDGMLDLICGNEDANTMYLNIDGIFTKFPEWSSAVETNTMSIAIGDIDLDGDLDLVCGNVGSPSYGQIDTGARNSIYFGASRPVFRNDLANPIHQLPNNPAFMRNVKVWREQINRYRVDAALYDVESDPAWIVAEYQFAGSPKWYPAVIDGQSGRIGMLQTSPAGVAVSFYWDLSLVPYDSREVTLRLTTVEVPGRVSDIQYTSAYLKRIGVIPTIVTHARPIAGTEFFENRDVIVELFLPQGVSFNQATLWYRRGGEVLYESAPFEDGNPRPFSIIPSEWLGARGIEYWVEVKTPEGNLSDPRVDAAAHPKTVRVTVLNHEEVVAHPAETYRLLSMPLELENISSIINALEDNIGFPDPLAWRMFAYDSTDSSYVEIPNDTLSSFELGRGYWLITKKRNRLDSGPVFGRSAVTDSAFAVLLRPGWNLVGHPFAFPVAWEQMLVNGVAMPQAQGVTIEPAYGWDGDGYRGSVTQFDPWEGYWVKNLADSVITLQIPAREVDGPVKNEEGPIESTSRVASGSPVDWVVTVHASCGEANDRSNYAGVSPGADNARDAFDRSDPPLHPGQAISLYFPHEEWERNPGNYSSDIRGAIEPIEKGSIPFLSKEIDAWGHVWRFDLAKNFSLEQAGDQVVLEFCGIENVPSGSQVLLVDTQRESVVDLQINSRYCYFEGVQGYVFEDKARFALIVGNNSFVNGQELPVLPTETVLHQNHPNPFNPSTLIRYDVAAAGRVRLAVYDVSGALVKVLEDRHRDPGRYEAGWDGLNQRGEPVSSGMYFYVLEAPGVRLAKKMLCVK